MTFENTASRPIVWSIAGSDCSGGAGIQADLKTMHNLGCDVCTVITANTAQNSFGVQEINAVSNQVLLSQLDSLAQDRLPSVIKIGLLANSQQVEIVASWILDLQNSAPLPRIVYDPVAIASAGGSLAEEDIIPSIKEKLLPLVDVLTPNAEECQRLSGVYIINWESMIEASRGLMKLGVGACIIKGGHIDVDTSHCVDMADIGEQQYWLASKRNFSEHNHGTGCTYASAIAALLAQGYLLRDAATVAKAFINQGLAEAASFQGAYGPIRQGQWPLNPLDYPEIVQSGSPVANKLDWEIGPGNATWATDFAACNTQSLGLYPVVDSAEWIEKLAKLGVKTIQLRIKNATQETLRAQIKKSVELGKQYNLRLFINDYWQLAIQYQAYGVHLGQEDIQSANLQAIKKAGLRLGISTHGEFELLSALQVKPSYIAVGAIYPTNTKDMTGQIQGVRRLSRYLKLVEGAIPMVAIGGITKANAPDVAATGVGSIAVVTAITQAENVAMTVEYFKQILSESNALEQNEQLNG
ncbi:thiamine phosphate synthase [Catenovulum sediminis]|uniref:Thiamine-phosphate synthase n=1 Tax=Catenovulum sediminis TaxID=1740262 RepID=A0ABV1RF65_9ALTE